MRRPEWAAAGTFPGAWRASERADNPEGVGPIARELLSDARIIHIPEPQMSALPPLDMAAVDFFRRAHVPFEPLYLSLDGVTAPFDDFVDVAGAVVGTPTVLPDDASDARGERIIVPLIRAHSALALTGFCWAHPDHTDALAVWTPTGGQLTEKGWTGVKKMIAIATERVLAALYFLESANVELIEGRAARQERRAVERRGGRVALTVLIRQPKKRPRHDGPADHPDWSHRWEVRGHYKHFPVGTKLADSRPDKLVDHPTLGQCRRIWCPPHVKGPQDKPLVPKLRLVPAGA